ncbi:ComEA family DNA-binding protein [Modicisalibacter coralii]|uniref:ComEA family DNA-binding protein n=1 Tax=Modicisalibacter coralii TaxID=2304602 RepID=UPI001F177965|nr:ComEA family DNA-binding protein [Halomonas coralii]
MTMKRVIQTLLLTLALGVVASPAFADDTPAIDVNTATAEQLAQLPGIGEVKAQAIVADRKANGDYQTVQDLARVDGIGDATIEGLEGKVSF